MESKYKIALIADEKKVEYIEESIQAPGESEVLVKVDACAICTLEQRVYSGGMKRYPFAGGHEVAGHVVKTGKKANMIKVGDRVALRLLNNCGECYYCRSGHENQCIVSFKAENHKEHPGPGGLAQYITVSAKAVYKMVDDVEPKVAALAEPLACCVHSINNANIKFGEDVVIIGAGIMGIFHIMLAKLRGARVIACEISDERLKIAQKAGADILINTARENGLEKVKELTDNRGADVVIDTVPVSSIAEEAVEMVGKLGRLVFYSSFHPDNPIKISPNKVHYSESIITGSVNPGLIDFHEATRLLSGKIIDPSLVISNERNFEDLEGAFEEALRPDTYRIIVTM